MEYLRSIWGGEAPEAPLPTEEEISPETQKTLNLVRETLGGLGDTFLRHSQGQLVESLNDDLTRTAVNSLLSSVQEYRTGLEPETLKARAVRTAEAQFHSVIKGSDTEKLLNELHDLVISPEGTVIPVPEGEVTTPRVQTYRDLQVEGIREQLNEKIEMLHEISEKDFKIPEKDLARLEDLQSLIFNPSLQDPEILEVFGDYCDKLIAASTYAARVRIDKGVMLQSVDVIQDFINTSNQMQEQFSLLNVELGDRPGSEILAEVAGAFVLNSYSGLEAEQLVKLGMNPKEVAALVDEFPGAGGELLEVVAPISTALSKITDKWGVVALSSGLMTFGVKLRELLSDPATRPIGMMAFQHFMESLDKIEGLTTGEGFVNEGGVEQLYLRKVGHAEKGIPKVPDFANTRGFETSQGPIQVPIGLLKDFRRSTHTVNGVQFRATADLIESKDPDDFVPLTDFLNALLDNGLSPEDVEALLLSSFQSLMADMTEHAAAANVVSGVFIDAGLEGAKAERLAEYTYDFKEDGSLEMRGISTEVNKTIEGLTFGTRGSVTVNFGEKEDGSIDFTTGSTVAEFSAIGGIHDAMTPEEFEAI